MEFLEKTYRQFDLNEGNCFFKHDKEAITLDLVLNTVADFFHNFIHDCIIYIIFTPPYTLIHPILRAPFPRYSCSPPISNH